MSNDINAQDFYDTSNRGRIEAIFYIPACIDSGLFMDFVETYQGDNIGGIKGIPEDKYEEALDIIPDDFNQFIESLSDLGLEKGYMAEYVHYEIYNASFNDEGDIVSCGVHKNVMTTHQVYGETIEKLMNNVLELSEILRNAQYLNEKMKNEKQKDGT